MSKQKIPGPTHQTLGDIRRTGLLWLFNTTALHPRGYALAFHWGDDADPNVDEPVGWSIVGDGSEPVYFGDPGDEEFQAVQRLLGEAKTT